MTIQITSLHITCGVLGPDAGLVGPGKSALASKQIAADVFRTGPCPVKQGALLSPDWQLTVAGFVGQLTIANQHYHEHGPMSIVHRYSAYEGDEMVVRGRPVTEGGAAILRSGVSTVLFNVFDLSSATAATAIHTETLPVDQMFSAALRAGSGWRKDAIGFSFEHTLDGLPFIEGGRVYRVEYVFGLSAGGSIKHAVEVSISGLLTPASELGN